MFWKKKTPDPPKQPTSFGVTELQVGDDCVCVEDSPHNITHQKLLILGELYKVRTVSIWTKNDRFCKDYGGPWIRVDGVFPIGDSAWFCSRFEKAVKKKTEISDWVKEPTGLDLEKEKEGAY